MPVCAVCSCVVTSSEAARWHTVRQRPGSAPFTPLGAGRSRTEVQGCSHEQTSDAWCCGRWARAEGGARGREEGEANGGGRAEAKTTNRDRPGGGGGTDRGGEPTEPTEGRIRPRGGERSHSRDFLKSDRVFVQ